MGDAPAVTVGLQQPRQHPGRARQRLRQRRGVEGAVRVDQHLGVALGQPEPAPLRRLGRVVAGEVAGDGLLLEPLARVPGGDAGPPGELGLGRRPQLVQRPVEPELDPQVDAEHLHRLGQPVDRPPGEHLTHVHVGRDRHGPSLPATGPSVGPPARQPAPGRLQPAYTWRTPAVGGPWHGGAMMPGVTGQPNEVRTEASWGRSRSGSPDGPSGCRGRGSGRCWPRSCSTAATSSRWTGWSTTCSARRRRGMPATRSRPISSGSARPSKRPGRWSPPGRPATSSTSPATPSTPSASPPCSARPGPAGRPPPGSRCWTGRWRCGGARPTPSSRRPSPGGRRCASTSSGWPPRRTGRCCCSGWTGSPRPRPRSRPSWAGSRGGNGPSPCWSPPSGQAGRPGEALAAFAGYRDRLRDELGLDPSPELRRLEEQVLRGTLATHRPRSGRPGRTATARTTRPRDLVRRPGTGAGRGRRRPWPPTGW